MANQQRIFYACQAVAITERGDAGLDANTIAHGVQSVGMSSTFSLDQVFELGQIEIYENIEQVSDIEVNIQKVIDGYRLLYDLASQGQCKVGVVEASKQRCDVHVGIFDDGVSHATGVPRNVCYNSGMFISSVSYNYSVDGNATEDISLVGNDRFWNGFNDTNVINTTPADIWTADVTSEFDGTDTPKSGVVTRVDVDLAASAIPEEAASQQDATNAVGIGSGLHIQSVSVSTDFGQEQIQELGRFGPYTRYATFPIEVTCDFEVIATSGDLINVSGNAGNLQDRQIIIKDTAGTVIDLGTKNKLTNVSYTGGDTGGGNATITYSYSNFNVLKVDGGAN
tara:strand:+ start:25753 stop:26769 length:1017 start_codon:yes stop_codon:yes gene_type:complete